MGAPLLPPDPPRGYYYSLPLNSISLPSPRLNKSLVESKPTDEVNGEIYDEIDTKKEMVAKQKRAKTEETVYEVNIAMETKSSTKTQDSANIYLSPRASSDGSAFEDVNVRRETEYQGLDLDNVDKDQPYADLSKTVDEIVPPHYGNM